MAAMGTIEEGEEGEQMLDDGENMQDPVDFGFIGHRIVSNTVCHLCAFVRAMPHFDAFCCVWQLLRSARAVSKFRILYNVAVAAVFIIVCQIGFVVGGGSSAHSNQEIVREFQSFTNMWRSLYQNASESVFVPS